MSKLVQKRESFNLNQGRFGRNCDSFGLNQHRFGRNRDSFNFNKGREKMFHTVDEAIFDLKAGKPIIVVDNEDRENEGDLVALSENITPEMINFMITHGKGLVCAPITAEAAERLRLPLMTGRNTDPYETAFTVSIDHMATTTGISAEERARTIQALIDPNTKAADFKQPGHVFPLIAKEGGVLTRPGHTEASVDLAELCGASASAVICEIIQDDGTMARVPELQEMAAEFDLKIITIESLITYRKQYETHIKREVETSLPTDFGVFNIYGYSNDLDQKEHLAFVKGELNKDKDEPVMVRVHSECLTGDIFGSHRCDCGPQLDEALEKIAAADHGVLIYMRQEGRGIGLINKLKAYQLQDAGLDTVEANEELGFAPDLREYGLSAQILQDLGVQKINLLTNNPDKIEALQAFGIDVEKRMPIQTASRQESEFYMQTKHDKFGHLLKI